MKSILENNFISGVVKEQTFYLPKEDFDLNKGIHKLINLFDQSENLFRSFAIIDTSDYLIEDVNYFIDFFSILAFESSRRIIAITPDKRVTDETLFVYFDSRRILDNFDAKSAFRADSFRLNGLLKMLFPYFSNMPPPETLLQS